MRIVAGEWKGRRLAAGEGLRPTGERVREALFSILGGRIDGLFVDAYAGTGAVGLEARSRGARVILVERDERALELIRRNVRELAPEGGVQVVAMDALRWLKSAREVQPAGVVFLDPPYDYGPHEKLLRLAGESPLVGDETLVVLEHRRGFDCARAAQRSGRLHLVRQETYGESVLSFMRRS